MNSEFKEDIIEEDLDTSWIDDFKKDNEKYSEFYTEEVTNITLFFIYIDHKNNIENLSRELLILDKKNTIIRDQLIQLIKQNHIQNNNNNNQKKSIILLIIKMILPLINVFLYKKNI
jgi:hypothetical protein